MILPKAFYFFFYAAAASLIPFLSLYYEHLGLNGRQIGLLTGLMPLALSPAVCCMKPPVLRPYSSG